MKYVAIIVSSLALVTACSRAAEPETSSPANATPELHRGVVAVPSAAGAYEAVTRDGFEPEISAAPLDLSTCRVIDVDAGRRALVVRSDGSGAPRTASVMVSRNDGATVNYSDTRGAFEPTLVEGRIVPPSGRVTRISINLAEDLGVASNEGGNQPNNRHVGTAAAFLDDAGFDHPRARITEIRERCGA